MTKETIKPTVSEQTLAYLRYNFNEFNLKINNAIKTLFDSGNPIVELDTTKNELWRIYLNSINDEHNPIFRTRKCFDGRYDRHFINHIGNIAMITPEYDIIPLWSLISLDNDSIFKTSLENLKNRTSKASIKSVFLSDIKKLGSTPSPDTPDSNGTILCTHYHYYTVLDNKYVSDSKNTEIGKLNNIKHIFNQSLEEASASDIGLILELINENSIYRGKEFKTHLVSWNDLLNTYNTLPESKKEGFIWYYVITQKHKVAFRNTVIGSLISDLFKGETLENAIKAYESKVAPENYKRPNPIVTSKMVKDAKRVVASLGYEDSFDRTAAQPSDIPSHNILFTNQIDKPISIFDDLTDDANQTSNKVDISKTTKRTIPELLQAFSRVASIEILQTSKLKEHEMVLTKGQTPSAKSPFKWNSDLSWSYINNRDVADTIKERVKSAGGNVNGDLRISLSWDNNDNLDLSAKFNKDRDYIFFENEKLNNDRNAIYFGNKTCKNGTLDLDANSLHVISNPIENIYWSNTSDIPNEDIIIMVKNQNKRTSENQGFTLQVEFEGAIYNFTYPNNRIRKKELLKLRYDKTKSIFTIEILDSKLSGGSIRVSTNENFIPVKSVILSPNAWSDKRLGNKHLFFLTNTIEVKEPVIGFFNEQLSSELEQHHKVTDLLSNKLKIKPEEFTHAASGYGISETITTPFYLRLTYHNGRTEFIECSN